MRAAAADVVVERQGDLMARRRRVSVEQGLGGDQDAGQAIAALSGLLVEKRLLQRVRPVRRAEPLDRQDALAGDRRQRLAAGFFGMAVDQHHAAAALFEAAAEFGADKAEVVAQDVEQRRVAVGAEADGLAVYGQIDRWHSPTPQFPRPCSTLFYWESTGMRS